MKKICLIIVVLLQLCFASAHRVAIHSQDTPSDVKTLNLLKLDIDSVSHLNSTIYVNLRGENDLQALQNVGFSFQLLEREIYGEVSSERLSAKANLPAGYPSYPAFEDYLTQVAAEYPQLCTLGSIGTSVEDRELYYLKFSNNPTQNQAKVKIKLISNIHGDEPLGYFVLLKLIELFTLEYGSDERITNIIDNSEIFIMPLMNPDGYVNVSRYNGNEVDINRNFPMPNGVENPDGHDYQPETLAMINWSLANNFSLGISFHSGSLVMNYPWDYSFAITPDNELLRELSLAYSVNNAPMYNSNEFHQGIVNGAQWYVITGSMQDWNYAFTSNIEITAEIGNTKWPHASFLPPYWEDNREAILDYIEYALRGIKGVVSSSDGTPLPAKISSFGASKTVFTDPENGDFHQILLPGSYRIMASADGYFPQMCSVSVPDEGYVVQDFMLEPAQQVSARGIVRNLDDLTALEGVELIVEVGDEVVVESDDDGAFDLPVMDEGIYLLRAEHPEKLAYLGYTAIKAHDGEALLCLPLSEPIWSENFESGANGWTLQGNWGVVQDGERMALTDSPAGNYSSNQNASATLANPISLSSIHEAQLSFQARWELEDGYDFVFVEIANSGGSWKTLDAFTGSQDTYIHRNYDLTAFAGSPVRLRFRLKTDNYINRDGIYVSNLRIIGKDESITLLGDVNADGYWNSQDLAVLIAQSMENEQNTQADLDQDGNISAIDAYYLLRFLKDPAFLLPASDPASAGLMECALIVHSHAQSFTFTLPPELRSLGIAFDRPISDASFTEQDASIYWQKSADNRRFTLIREKEGGYPPMDIRFRHEFAQEGLHAQCEINGHPTTIHITPNAIDDTNQAPLITELYANYPNPFNPQTVLSFQLSHAQKASLVVYNMKGQRVRKLLSDQLSAGKHCVEFDGLDDAGNSLSSGIYFYTLKTKDTIKTKKMILCK